MPSEHLPNEGRGRSLLRVSRVAPKQYDIVRDSDEWTHGVSEALVEHRISENGASTSKSPRKTPKWAKGSSTTGKTGVIQYKNGVEVSPMELWTVDVTAPDIETKSYMRNTLASESRRRTHINRCKSKGKPVNWPWWMQVPLQNKHAIPTIPDDPTYSPEGLSGSERKKWMDRRPTSLKTAEWAPPLLGSDPTVKLLGGLGAAAEGNEWGGGEGGVEGGGGSASVSTTKSPQRRRRSTSPRKSRNRSPVRRASHSPVSYLRSPPAVAGRTTTVGEYLLRSERPYLEHEPRQFPPASGLATD